MAEPAAGRRPFAARLHRGELAAVALLAAFVAAFTAAAALSGGEAVLARLARLAPGVVAGLLALSLVNYALRTLRWQLFGRRLGVAPPWPRGALYYVAGFAMTATPGKLGEALRLWLLRRGHGYRYEHTAGLFVADRLSDAGAIVLLCVAGIAGMPGYLWPTLVAGVLVAATTLALLHPRLAARPVEGAYAVLRRWPRGFARLRGALRHAGRLASWRVYGGTLALAVVGWGAEALAFAWLLAALGAPLPLLQATFVFAFAMLVGAAAMLPGGLGGTEATMIALLVAAGVPADAAIGATAVIRITTLWFAVALGFLALPAALKLAARPAAVGASAGPG